MKFHFVLSGQGIHDNDDDNDNDDDDDDDIYRSNGDFHVRDKEAIVAPSSRYEQPTYHTHYLVRW